MAACPGSHPCTGPIRSPRDPLSSLGATLPSLVGCPATRGKGNWATGSTRRRPPARAAVAESAHSSARLERLESARGASKAGPIMAA